MNHYLTFGSNSLARALVVVLSLQLADSPADAQTLPTALDIVIVRGDGATGRVRQRASQDPVVRVVDQDAKPVAGAAVVFTLPTEGATGEFGKGLKTLTVLTDREGTAAAQGLRFNQVPGKVQVHINASYKGLTARSSIIQLSEAPAGYKPGRGGSGKVIAILAVIAAGGAGGAVLATRKNSATPAAPPSASSTIGLTPGAATIAPPR